MPEPVARTCNLLLKPLSYTIKKSIGKITTKHGRKVPLDPDLKKNLMKEYRNQVQRFYEILRTHKLIDTDLMGLWKYDRI